ncbi:BTAD domain-containing putative transcriptional regulator [Actinoplanes sp. NPDC051411]|uniref:AfsR/SARP family transcriptional regulator n=1 Tax=Actinoplanes sp. NPDC051411 TaxID=3155522 RepID=UPI003414B4F7
MTSDVAIAVMGALELRAGERVLTPSAPKLRSLLALLALRSNQIVTTGTLMEELWENDPPVSALATLQTYIYQLRRVLAKVGPDAQILQTKPQGYVIRLERDKLDWNQFKDHVRDGRAALDRGGAEAASAALGRALALSTGDPLADVEAGPILSAHINELTENKLQALELRIEADLRLGRARQLIAELKTLIAANPYHEDFYFKLMLSLEYCGRRVEALEVYQELRRTLVEELGIEPSAKVQQLQLQLLTVHEGSLSGADTDTATIATITPRITRPAQLPPDLPDFAGRASAVSMLGDLSLGTDGTPAARLLHVTGMLGIGKTALALHVAHLIRERFVDGQFHADLGNGSGRPADPYAVLGRFLRATGLADADLPQELDERAQMFRSWTADRNVLVLLDDAASASQVAPLLPGGSRCTALITSCCALPGLHGARVLELEPLEIDSCAELLAALIGRDRVEREEDMARSIAQLCGRLPLAIRVIGTKLREAPRYPLRKMVRRLADECRLLPELCTEERGLGDRLCHEHARLSADARHLLSRIVGESANPFVDIGKASALGDLDLYTTELLIEELVRARFLRTIDLDGYGAGGYVVPVVVRSFVRQNRQAHEVPVDPTTDSRIGRAYVPAGPLSVGNGQNPSAALGGEFRR